MTKPNPTTDQRKEHKRKLRKRWERRNRWHRRWYCLAYYHGTFRDWWFLACIKAGVDPDEVNRERNKLLGRGNINRVLGKQKQLARKTL